MAFVAQRHEIEICPNHGLSVVQCGWQKCSPSHQCGPMFYQNYSVTFVLSGCGYYTINGRTEKIQAGEGFIIIPGMRIFYIADSETPWEYIYAIVKGPDVPALLNAAGLDEERFMFNYPADAEYRAWLDAMCRTSSSSEAQGYDVIGYFSLCMSRIVQQHSQKRRSSVPQEEYILKALAYMQSNYANNIRISDVAAYVGVERSYLYRLFTQRVGESPHQWLIRYRLEQSAEMLLKTDYSITEIAYSVGFYDVPHYSRSFRACFRCSPVEYRKRGSAEKTE